MRVSSHWRMKQQLYRLQGTRYQTGATSLVNRQQPYPVQDLSLENNVSSPSSLPEPILPEIR